MNIPKSLLPTDEELTEGLPLGRGLRQFLFVHWNLDVKPEVIYPDWSYIAYQEEICPKSGRHHYQGYMQITSTKVKGYKQMAKCNPSNCWFRACFGTDVENHAYCTKSDTAVPDTFVQFGTRRGFKGLKLEFSHSQAKLQILAGTFNKDESPAHTIFFYEYRASQALTKHSFDRQMQARDYSDTKIYFFSGVSGAGKTYDAKYGVYQNGELVGHDLTTKFHVIQDYYVGTGEPLFNLYEGQSRIIIDEADKRKEFDVNFFVKATSGQCYECPCRNAPCVMRGFTEVFVCMNESFQSFFNKHKDADCLGRRITAMKLYRSKHPSQHGVKSLWDRIQEAETT